MVVISQDSLNPMSLLPINVLKKLENRENFVYFGATYFTRYIPISWIIGIGGGMFVLRPHVHRKITNWAKGNIIKYKELKSTRLNRLKIKINEKIISPIPNMVINYINNHNKKNRGNKITLEQLDNIIRFMVGWNIAIFINESFIMTPFYCLFAYFFFETFKEKCAQWNYCYGESNTRGKLKSMIEEDVVNAPIVSDILETFSEMIKNELTRREIENIQKFEN